MSIVLDPKRVSCISGNFWRGNFPLTKDRQVDFNQLEQLLSVGGNGLVEICLTDNAGEADLLEVLEKTYGCRFTRHLPPFQEPGWDPTQFQQQLGHNRWLYWWPIEGGTTPDVLSTPGYNFTALIKFIAQMIKENPQRRIYVHCMNGTDRTGAVAAAYAIKYMAASLEDAIAWSARTNAGKMSQPYVDLVTAFSKA